MENVIWMSCPRGSEPRHVASKLPGSMAVTRIRLRSVYHVYRETAAHVNEIGKRID